MIPLPALATMADAPSAAEASTRKGSSWAAPSRAAVMPVTAKSTEPVTTAVLISVELAKSTVSIFTFAGRNFS